MLKRDHPLRVAILSSRRAPGLRDLLADPHRGSLRDLSEQSGLRLSDHVARPLGVN
jgi:hypothetical protein